MQAKHSDVSTKRPFCKSWKACPSTSFRFRRFRAPSKGEMRKMTQQGGLSVNKEKATDPYATVTVADLLNGKYLLVQRGKKNYFLLIAQ